MKIFYDVIKNSECFLLYLNEWHNIFWNSFEQRKIFKIGTMWEKSN